MTPPAGRRRVALVTGASRGIGRAIALALAERGDEVCALYRDREADAAAVVDAVAQRGGRAYAQQADLADPAAVAAVFSEIEARSGGLDVLVNNAATTRDRLLVRMSEAEWEEVIATNLTGTWRCIKQAVPLMRRRGGGAVVNVGSSGVFHGNPGQANYAASKGGVLAMVRSLRWELGPWGIRINAVVPGFARTDMTAELPAERIAAVEEATPLGRLCTPEDIAQAVVFLTGAASACVTGQTLVVDGGRT